MMPAAIMRSIFQNRRASVIVEFAIIGPVLIMLLLGILWTGIQMQKFNALRSIAADVERYTVVEYQKNNKLGALQIKDVATSKAVRPPYGLTGDQLDVEVTQVASPMSGTKAYSLKLTYTPYDDLKGFGVPAIQMRYSQSIYVSDR